MNALTEITVKHKIGIHRTTKKKKKHLPIWPRPLLPIRGKLLSKMDEITLELCDGLFLLSWLLN